MSAEAPTTPEPTRRISGRILYVLDVVRKLITYGRHFTATAAERVAAPEFSTVAFFFGTYDLTVILLRMRRGILRALALERYLLARGARGRTLRFEWKSDLGLLPHHRPPPRPAPPKRDAPVRPYRPDPSLLGPDDPRAFYLPTEAELDAEVRRRPVGRTITYICLDLGLSPVLCDSDLWLQVYKILRSYRGNIHHLFDVGAVREKAFERERDRRPETWDINWRDRSRATVRKALGCLIGEEPPDPGLPVIVPS